MFGWRTDRDEALKIIDYAINNDIRFIDTSISYGRGSSHELLAECICQLNCRDKITLATKVGGISSKDNDPNSSGFDNKNLTRQVELSLRQLKTDYIDLLQIHYPIEDQRTLDNVSKEIKSLFSAGKIRNIGVSNHNQSQYRSFKKSVSLPSDLTIPNQIEVSLLNTKGIREFSQYNNIELIAWGPLSSGLLTSDCVSNNSIQPFTRIATGRELDSKVKLLTKEETQHIFSRLATLSSDTGISVTQIAFSWVLSLKQVRTILTGPSDLQQLKHILEILSWDNNIIDQISVAFQDIL